jgi:hypothetical protein
VSELIGLIEFYDIRGWESWGDTDAGSEALGMVDSDDDESPDIYRTVEEAVKANPERALQELANHLGLPYHRMREYEEKRMAVAAPTASTVKRKPDAAMLDPEDQRAKASRPGAPNATQWLPSMDVTLDSRLSLAEPTNTKPAEETTPEPLQTLGFLKQLDQNNNAH